MGDKRNPFSVAATQITKKYGKDGWFDKSDSTKQNQTKNDQK